MKKQVVSSILALLVCFAFLQTPGPSYSQGISDPGESTSILPPDQLVFSDVLQVQQAGVITFSEYPRGTTITNQYASQGIIFGGTTTFITSDGANPTSPVLSGTPTFQGSIEGRFVNPSDGKTPTIVESFSLDAGYFDANGSTRIEWFDPQGNKLGQRTNTKYGIERFEIRGGNIARWKISIVANEPAGFAIDNVALQAAKTSILFRESLDDKKAGTWGYQDEIPGWDHTAFNYYNLVYESHPGYAAGNYISADGKETRVVTRIDGVQAQHSRLTFEHESTTSNTTLTAFEEIPISPALAEKMRAQIQTQIALNATFRYIDYSPAGLVRTLAPDKQKGGDDHAYTCVGLVEWSAEKAGHNGGQGFIKNVFESAGPIPLLSPELLNYALKYEAAMNGAKQWYQGLFDPVDFMITDPLGRKLGYTASEGEKNEIPNAFFSGNGVVEQFFIPNPVAGTYTIQFSGLNKQVYGGMSTQRNTFTINQFMAQGKQQANKFWVERVPGTPGDLNFDGSINKTDLSLLRARLNTFTNGPNDPADINGDGLINVVDERMLNALLKLQQQTVFLPVIIR